MRSSASWIAVIGCGLAAAAETGPVASFESDADNPFHAVGGAHTERVRQHASDGVFSLRVVFRGANTDTWPGILLPADNGGDWSRREILEMDVFLEGDAPARLATRFDAEERPAIFGGTTLRPGWNRGCSVNLKSWRAESDLTRAKGLLIYASKPREDVVLHVDNVRWGTFQGRYRRIEYIETQAPPEPTPEERQRGFIVWGHSPLQPVFQVNRPTDRLDAVRLFLARDELDPAAFGVYALRDLQIGRAHV